MVDDSHRWGGGASWYIPSVLDHFGYTLTLAIITSWGWWDESDDTALINPLSPHDALKHHLASLKNDLTSWNLAILERKFSWNRFKKNSIFIHLSPTSSHLHPLQVENCGSNSRLVVDEDDNGKLRLQRVKQRMELYTHTTVDELRGWTSWHPDIHVDSFITSCRFSLMIIICYHVAGCCLVTHSQ